MVVDLNHEFDEELSEGSHKDIDVNDRDIDLPKANDKFTKKLTKTILEYENLLAQDAFKDINEKNDVKKLLNSLKAQLDNHVNHKNKPEVKEISIEEKREKILQEIFDFYARQHIPPGLPFEQLEETLKSIQVGELILFCKDFGIEIERKEAMKLYTKISVNNMPHKFPQFKQSLKKIGEMMHNKNLDKLKKELSDLKSKMGEKSQKSPKSESGKSSSSGSDSEGEGSGSDSDKKSDASGASKSKKSAKQSTKTKSKKGDASPKKGDAPPKKEEPPADVKKADEKFKKDAKNVKPDPKAAKKDDINKKEPAKSKGKPSSNHSNSGSDKGSKKSGSKSSSEGSKSGSDSGSDSGSNSGSDNEDNKNEEANLLMIEHLQELKSKITEDIEVLEKLTEEEVYERFIQFLEIDHPAKYKHKVKGIRLAFDVKDTKSRIPLSMNTAKFAKNIFKKTKLSADEIKLKVKQMKEDRIQKKVQIELAEKQKYDKNRDYLKEIHKKLRHDKLVNSKNEKVNYSDIKIRNMGIPSWDGKHSKVTMEVLNKMHYSDFNIDDDDDFNPTDVLDDEEIAKINSPKKKLKKKNSLNTDLIVNNSMTDIDQKAKTSMVKRGTQMNQSQMSEARNKGGIHVTMHNKAINQAYDYGKNSSGTGDVKKVAKAFENKARVERSVPKLTKSFDLNAYNPSIVPRTKQAISSNRLKIAGSQQDLKNKSMHYRRATQDSYPMKIHDSYTMASKNKLPGMKQQMRDRAKQIESTNRVKEKRNMDSILKMHNNQINKGLKTLDKSRYK